MWDRAIADYTQAIKIDPRSPLALKNRAGCYDVRQEYDKAVADYEAAIELDPKDVSLYRSLHTILNSHPEAKLLGAKKAVESARKLCELTRWKEAADLHFLAAANASDGDFAAAVTWQSKAVELVTGRLAQANYTAWLECYKAGKTTQQDEDKTLGGLLLR